MEAPSWAVLGHERGVPRLDHVNLTPKGRWRQ
jgi:probable phosphoglycerate mutase